jgi:hypothetical protein
MIQRGDNLNNTVPVLLHYIFQNFALGLACDSKHAFVRTTSPYGASRALFFNIQCTYAYDVSILT